MKEQISKGSKVAWQGICDPMAGTVTFIGFSTYDVTRVDGGYCSVQKNKCRIATCDDINKAIEVFTK